MCVWKRLRTCRLYVWAACPPRLQTSVRSPDRRDASHATSAGGRLGRAHRPEAQMAFPSLKRPPSRVMLLHCASHKQARLLAATAPYRFCSSVSAAAASTTSPVIVVLSRTMRRSSVLVRGAAFWSHTCVCRCWGQGFSRNVRRRSRRVGRINKNEEQSSPFTEQHRTQGAASSF